MRDLLSSPLLSNQPVPLAIGATDTTRFSDGNRPWFPTWLPAWSSKRAWTLLICFGSRHQHDLRTTGASSCSVHAVDADHRFAAEGKPPGARSRLRREFQLLGFI